MFKKKASWALKHIQIFFHHFVKIFPYKLAEVNLLSNNSMQLVATPQKNPSLDHS